jgi:hypothetical protein
MIYTILIIRPAARVEGRRVIFLGGYHVPYTEVIFALVDVVCFVGFADFGL